MCKTKHAFAPMAKNDLRVIVKKNGKQEVYDIFPDSELAKHIISTVRSVYKDWKPE